MNLEVPSRRRFLSGVAASLLVAPAIVQSASIMAVRSPIIDVTCFYRDLYVGIERNGGWFGRTPTGFVPFELLEWLDEGRFEPTGPATKRVRVVEFESSWQAA